MKIVCPLESKADTQRQLHPRFLRLSAMISQYFECLFVERVRGETLPVANAVFISAQTDFAIVRLTSR
jgi:hypothetical protein